MLKKSENSTDRLEESKKLLEQFMSRPVTIKPVIPVGNHKAIFNGFATKMFRETMGFEIKLQINGIDYTYDMPFSAASGEKAERQMAIYEGIMRDIGRQLGLYGDVYIDTLNEHVGKEIDLHVVVKDGRRFTNFYKAKEVKPETEIVQF